MALCQCPNRRCGLKYIFTDGFRPIHFSCPECGTEGEWYSKYDGAGRHGFIRWSEGLAPYYVTMLAIVDTLSFTGLIDELTEIVSPESKVEQYLEDLSDDIADAQEDRPLLSSSGIGMSLASIILTTRGRVR